MAEHLFTNQLINESSPYLLQHAHNPVNWVAWSEVAFEQAKQQNKLVILSIGYSACHWCHVMEHESFENEAVAQLMNQHFICIKIDREEHPHIDSLYMSAVQLMNKQGGWPLNCITLPDGRPIYGGTYFPKEAWLEILESLANIYRNDLPKVLEYADRITNYLQNTELIALKQVLPKFEKEQLNEAIEKWVLTFDNEFGGPQRAPKFPLPNNYSFLLHYANNFKEKKMLDHVALTLEKMAKGGIFDQLGGGFSRYSVDDRWKVPHFEKMLYDNAQLISLYAEAFARDHNPFHQAVVEHTLRFIAEELTNESGAFYAALDADSEGIEGKYYTWNKAELQQTLTKEEYKAVETHFHINANGHWEHDRYILLCEQNPEQSAEILNISLAEFEQTLKSASEKLLIARRKRVKPGLDNKIITSWNGLMIKALADTGRVFQKAEYLGKATKAMHFVEDKLTKAEGGLWHIHNNESSKIDGLLEDYAFIIEAYISLYQASFEEKWLHKALNLMLFTLENFSDEDGVFFYFNNNNGEQLISRKKEISDNVIPAANSVMATNLFVLGKYFYRDSWVQRAEQMLSSVLENMQGYLPGYSNWGRLWLWQTQSFHEVALTGPEAINWAKNINHLYLPNVLLAASNNKSDLPMLNEKYSEKTTLAYVCHNKRCEQPCQSLAELITELN